MTQKLALVPKTENTGDSIPIGQPSNDIAYIVVGIGAADAGHPTFSDPVFIKSIGDKANKAPSTHTPIDLGTYRTLEGSGPYDSK